jgi:hypothetical protein
MALPRIFKSLDFSGSLSGAEPGYASFCRAVVKGQEPAASLSCHVTECTFTKWLMDNKQLRWVYDGFLGMYGQALGRMSNLQSVNLNLVDIDKRLLKAICGLKSVQSLSIDHCSLLEVITDTAIQKLTPLNLKSFSYGGIGMFNFPTKILTRIVNTSSLENLKVDNWDIARVILMQFDNHSSLVQLDLAEARDDPILWKVLELSKAMKRLRICNLSGASLSISPLSPSSMPQLCTLETSPLLASALVPGRPIRTVIISDDQCSQVIGRVELDRLRHSIMPIRTLQIPIDFYPDIPFDKLPQMEVLRLTFPCEHNIEDLENPSWLEDVSLVWILSLLSIC